MAPQNTPGLGIEYEVYVPAYFALFLNTHKEVEDFSLESNVQGFGNLDDILITIKTKNEQLHFAFQLKHKENFNKNLLPTTFETKSDFNLEKYCETFTKLKQEQKNKYNFIIYTNQKFEPSRVQDVTKFDMFLDSCVGKGFFDSSLQGWTYKFRTNSLSEDGRNVTKQDYEQFFSQLTLYPGQKNYRQFEREILKILKYKEQFLKYVDFFRKWHRGEFTNKVLDKRTVNILLVDIFLSSLIIKDQLVQNEDDLNLLESAIKEFDVTVIEDSKINFFTRNELSIFDYVKRQLNKYAKIEETVNECLLRVAKDFKIITRNTKEMENDTKLKLLCYIFRKPLVIECDAKSQELIHQALELYNQRENKILFVLVGEGIACEFTKFHSFHNFQQLSQVNHILFEKIAERCCLSLQGRQAICLQHLLKEFEDISVGLKEVVQMLGGCLLIEEKEQLPHYYINRTVSSYCFDIELILNHCIKTKELVFIDFQNNSNHFADYINKKGLKLMPLGKFKRKHHPSEDLMIVSVDEEYRPDQLKKLCQENAAHFFKRIEEDKFILLMSSEDTSKIKYPKLKISIEENCIPNHFINPVNILCAGPGVGKSTFLKHLKTEYSSDWWILSVNLKSHNSFLRNKLTTKQFLDHFIDENEDQFARNLKLEFRKRKKMVIFMDGLDEIEGKSIDNVVQYVKELSSMGYRIWLSTRPNLQNMLEDQFHVFVVEMDDLTEEQQERFVRKRLLDKYIEAETEEITKKIFNNANVANNRKILGIPLQLHIITQIFLDEHYQNLDQDFFILTNMYRNFFEGRYRHWMDKMDSDHTHLLLHELEDRLEKYQIAALETLFNEEVFAKLDLNLQRNRRFLTEVKKYKDPLGIIIQVDEKSKATFEHQTFAEYFASLFLVENLNQVQVLKEHLFSETYQNLLVIFNIMLAEKNQLHLSFIYRNTEQMRRLLIDGSVQKVDRGGRNLLHLLASMGTRHPRLRVTSDLSVKDNIIKSFTGESSYIKEVLSYCLLSGGRLLHVDSVFQWTPLEYALASGSLYIVEEMLDKCGKPADFRHLLRQYYDDVNILYYSLRFGYPNLLSAVLSKKYPLTDIVCSSLHNHFFNHSILCLAVRPQCSRKIEVIKILISRRKKFNFLHHLVRKFFNNDSTVSNEILRYAAILGDLSIVKFLLQEGADVDCQLELGQSILSVVVEQQNFPIASFLVRRGAKVNWRDHAGNTPLHYAARKGNMKIFQLLLDGGADVNAFNNEDKSVLAFAARSGHLDVVQKLLTLNARMEETVLCQAARGGNVEVMRVLMEVGADIDKTDKWEQAPLHKAVLRGKIEVVKFLLEKGADVNLADIDGDTVLHYAARRTFFSLGVTELLLDKAGHLLSVANKKGVCPLFLFVHKGLIEVVEMLEKKGVDLAKVDVYNVENPLHIAARDGVLQMDLLLRLTRIIKEKQQEDEKFYYKHNLIQFLTDLNLAEAYPDISTT